jgi:YfiH family protein
MTSADWITPDWPAPAGVHAVCTTRHGGVSQGPYASMNPADHVGDTATAVGANRQRLARVLDLPAAPVWLQQVHGTTVIDATDAPAAPQADAAFSCRPDVVCAVLTADCLPLLLCNRAGTVVAAAHAGWRGLAAGVVEQSVAALDVAPVQLLAWLGPAIGPAAYTVGEEVREAFIRHDPRAAAAFAPAPGGGWLADLYRLARQRLAACGIDAVFGGGRCTFTEAQDFFSYRRDGVTGRMATLIWLENR